MKMSSEFLSRHLVSFGGGKDTERERDKTHNARGNNNDEKSTKRDQKLFTKTTVVVVFLRGETRSKD